jgi:gliding motility-associated-like protein
MKLNISFRSSVLLFISILTIAIPGRSLAQCSSWSASATLTAASSCAANGAFTVSLSGSDVANLSNIQYGIPLAPNGFALPLNSSPNFNNIPPGTYQVSVVADCGGVPVGRNTTIVVPGAYTPPVWNSQNSSTRPSLSCAATGWINGYVTGGIPPFTFTLLTYPTAYTGPKTVISNFNYGSGQFVNLPPGNYSIQVSDACQSGTAPTTMTVASLNPASAPISVITAFKGCDSLEFKWPTMFSGPWSSYQYDTGFKFTMSVSGGILPTTQPVSWLNTDTIIKLPGGKTIKDLYGDTIIYTVIPPCGSSTTIRIPIPPAGLDPGISLSYCDTEFRASPYVNFSSACWPITFTLLNTGTNKTYGPYVTPPSGRYVTPNAMPFGTYKFSWTTADGYSGSKTVTVSAPTSKPYSVSVINGAVGLNNFIDGFYFSDISNSRGSKTLELFSGPSGYSYVGQWSGVNFSVFYNQSPTPTTLKFPAGNYVWKITDDCGVHYLPITVTAQDLYQFTVGAPTQLLTCQGLLITPTGTASNNGTARTVSFAVYLNGQPYYIVTPTGTSWPRYPAGTPILLTTPGTYTILVCASGSSNINVLGYFSSGGFSIGFPNIYTSTYTFTYTAHPLQFDVNTTQGFLCKGGAAGTGQIYATAKGGIMIPNPTPHYSYYLSLPGNALTGPYIASNSTGIFTGFGANANGLYDVKVVDSCGAFAVQQVKILDLGSARLITSTHYSACIGNNIQLSAAYLPNATYLWTGPAGFTSTLRQPTITNAGPSNAGIYRVTISTTSCNQSISDSTVIVINPNPPKPLVSTTCSPRPILLSVTNAAAGAIYKWDIGRAITTYGLVFQHDSLRSSDTLRTKHITYKGSYAPVAIDTLTGCSMRGDSLVFLSNPLDSLTASIYSPHLQLCTGDSTILVAKWTSGALNPAFQWYRNGLPISGATKISYTTNIAGSFRVFVDGGLCNTDTAAAVNVSVVSPPSGTLSISKDSICTGDTAMLQAATGAGYGYMWYLNGSVIPGAGAALYPATQAGSYSVMITNGACFTNSITLPLTVIPSPNVVLNPSSPQTICAGAVVRFSTALDSTFTYSWSRNGTIISGAKTDTFNASLDGSYRVIVATKQCPHTASPAVAVTVLPSGLTIGNDTLICLDTTFPIPLSIADGFKQILWSTGDTSKKILAPGGGYYWVRAQNSCGTFTDTMRIYTKADYDPGLPDDTLICTTTGITRLSVPQGLQNIVWSTGAKTSSITTDTPGTYWVEALSPCGMVWDTVRVHFCPPDIHDFSLSSDSICEGDCLEISAIVYNNAKSYQWTFAGGSPSTSNVESPGTVCYAKAGIYPVILIARNVGGEDTVEGLVVVSAMPTIRFKDTVIRAPYKSSITIPACANAQHVDWYKDDSLVCSDCPVLKIDARYYLTSYRCVVRNGECPDTCNYSLRVVDIPRDVWLPDAFTPNGDSRNDIFHVITDNPNIEIVNLAVFNRWGQQVFASDKSRDGWDGKFKGSPAEAGSYFWQLSYRVLGEKETILRKGDVLLIR